MTLDIEIVAGGCVDGDMEVNEIVVVVADIDDMVELLMTGEGVIEDIDIV